MKYERQSKSGLFLMEIILAILFFSVASVVCVKLFANAHLTSQDSNDRTHAMLHAQNVAECYKAVDGSLEEMKQLLGGLTMRGSLVLYYNSQWEESQDVDEVAFALIVTQESDAQATLTVARIDFAPLFTLPLAHNGSTMIERG